MPASKTIANSASTTFSLTIGGATSVEYIDSVFLSLYIIHPKIKELKIDLKHVTNTTTLNIITTCCGPTEANMGTAAGTMSKFNDLGTLVASSYVAPGTPTVYKASGGSFATTFLNKMANT